MVIPSDITRWGFEFNSDVDGDKSFDSGDWHIVIYKAPDQDFEDRNRVGLFKAGDRLFIGAMRGPHHIFRLLHREGYFAENNGGWQQ